MHEVADGDGECVVLVLHRVALAPSDGPCAMPMRWTLCKAHVTDITQGPCNRLYVGSCFVFMQASL
eukprot:5627213-Pleurochrysis_carterae.AAC.1